MPAIIIGILMLFVSIILLITKGRTSVLVKNLIIMGIYEGFLIVGAVSAHDLDGIFWALVAISFGGVHLLVLFIVALSLPDLNKQEEAEKKAQLEQNRDSMPAEHRERIEKAMQSLPEQDRAKVNLTNPDNPLKKPAAQKSTSQGSPSPLTEWEAKQRFLLSKLEADQGGELPFD